MLDELSALVVLGVFAIREVAQVDEFVGVFDGDVVERTDSDDRIVDGGHDHFLKEKRVTTLKRCSGLNL